MRLDPEVRLHRHSDYFGTEVVEMMVDYGFRHLGLRRVLLDVAEDNPRARHVYEKIGFVPFGQHIGAQGATYVDMALPRRDWISRFSSNATALPVRSSAPSETPSLSRNTRY